MKKRFQVDLPDIGLGERFFLTTGGSFGFFTPEVIERNWKGIPLSAKSERRGPLLYTPGTMYHLFLGDDYPFLSYEDFIQAPYNPYTVPKRGYQLRPCSGVWLDNVSQPGIAPLLAPYLSQCRQKGLFVTPGYGNPGSTSNSICFPMLDFSEVTSPWTWSGHVGGGSDVSSSDVAAIQTGLYADQFVGGDWIFFNIATFDATGGQFFSCSPLYSGGTVLTNKLEAAQQLWADWKGVFSRIKLVIFLIGTSPSTDVDPDLEGEDLANALEIIANSQAHVESCRTAMISTYGDLEDIELVDMGNAEDTASLDADTLPIAVEKIKEFWDLA